MRTIHKRTSNVTINVLFPGINDGGKPAVNASPKKGVKFKMDDFSDFDDSDLDIENIS